MGWLFSFRLYSLEYLRLALPALEKKQMTKSLFFFRQRSKKRLACCKARETVLCFDQRTKHDIGISHSRLKNLRAKTGHDLLTHKGSSRHNNRYCWWREKCHEWFQSYLFNSLGFLSSQGPLVMQPRVTAVFCGGAAEISRSTASWGLGHLDWPETRWLRLSWQDEDFVFVPAHWTKTPQSSKKVVVAVLGGGKPPQRFLHLWLQRWSVLFLLMR